MKKVYFACSIAGGRDHAHVYVDIVSYLKAAGAQVTSEMFAEKDLKAKVGMKMDPAYVWQRDLDMIKEADALVAEVTQPSLGVGYEIALAEKFNKPILALFYEDSGRRLSPMIAGNPNVQVFRYTSVKDIEKVVKEFLSV